MAIVFITAIGCSDAAGPTPQASKPTGPPAAVLLTVLVAGDEELAEGVRLLRGEWKARSGGELLVETITLEDLQKPEPLSGDLVIFPSRWLGALAEHSQLRPLRNSMLESPELGLADVFPAIRNGEMRYGGQTLALPLGSPPLLAYSRPNLLAEQPASDWTPSKTWEAYSHWIGVGTANAQPTAQPLAGRAAAYTLIARAMSYTETPQRAEALFDAENMSPRIAEPPFVRALAEINEEAAVRGEQPPVDFADGVELVRTGKVLATLGWPSLLQTALPPADTAAADAAAFSPLPVAEQAFSQSQQRWENQSFPQSVTLLGVEGRLVGVCRSSRNAVSAFKLSQWLTTGDVAVQLSSRSRGTLWYRASQAGSYARWTGGEVAKVSQTPVTKVVAEALATETPVMVPRVPAIDEYMEALAEAVRAADQGEAAAKASLTAAAKKWDAITERLGRKEQARAYRRHLGIDALEN